VKNPHLEVSYIYQDISRAFLIGAAVVAAYAVFFDTLSFTLQVIADYSDENSRVDSLTDSVRVSDHRFDDQYDISVCRFCGGYCGLHARRT